MTGYPNQQSPSGAIPAFPGGVLWSNLTTEAYTQIKAAPGTLVRLGVNTAGTTSTAAFYDGLSATVTITIASPGVATWNNHGLAAGTAVRFQTTGALPTGLTAGTTYYVTNDSNLTADTFAVSDTQAHALAGTNQVDTSGSQSGAQTGWNVNNPIGSYATTAQNSVDIGAMTTLGLICITAGGAAADVTVFYV